MIRLDTECGHGFRGKLVMWSLPLWFGVMVTDLVIAVPGATASELLPLAQQSISIHDNDGLPSDTGTEIAPSGDSASSIFWTLGSDVANVCAPQKPLLRIGRTDFHVFPVPLYLEEYGWDPGVLISLGVPIGMTLSGLFSWSEREDRVGERLNVAHGFRISEYVSTWSRLEGYARFGHRGVAGIIGVGVRTGDRRGILDAELAFIRQELRPIGFLTPTDWDTGNESAIQLSVEAEDMFPPSDDGPHLRWRLTSLVSGRALDGEFPYRAMNARIQSWYGQWDVRAFAGVGDGLVPTQHLYDAGIEGMLMGVPIRAHRGRGLRAVTVERRAHILSEYFVRLFASAAGVDGVDGTLFEWGLSLSVEDPDYPMSPDGVMFRFDFPLYSSHADRFHGARRKWDTRRFGFRLNFPWPSFAGRQEETRYRYSGR